MSKSIEKIIEQKYYYYMQAHYHFRQKFYYSNSGAILILSFGGLLIGAPLLYPDKLLIDEINNNMLIAWGLIFSSMYIYIQLQKKYVNHRNFCLNHIVNIYLLCKEAKLKEVSFSQGSDFLEMLRDFSLVAEFYEYDILLKDNKISYKKFREKIESDTNNYKENLNRIKMNLFYGFIIFMMFSLAFKYYSTKF